MVICENCQSVINFYPKEPSDEPVVYYVKVCSKCTGTVEDERKVEAMYFPDAYI